MGLKKNLLILIITFSISNLFGQNNLQTPKANNKSFPTNIKKENFKDIETYNGKVVAFDGIIEMVKISRNNTPLYKLKVTNSNYLWTVLMFNNEANKTGDTIRVVGYLGLTEPNEIEKKYLDGKYMVIAFGLIDFKNSNFLFLGGASKQKQEWIDGKIPSSK